jgi:diaminohydroxyphosphoribosylaminopyrimidine deaminase/5-amino-6-(5-phosphoribosylamino)uracil reductase
MTLKQNEEFMRMALELAQKGRTSPNPKVGAVIVKDERVLATGYHQKAGMPHAEIEAIGKLKPEQLKGSTLYITLEPCSHSGNGKKTPPCVPVIIKSGISRIVCAMADPNPKVNGNGIAAFKKAKIEVTAGILESDARKLNESYSKRITTGLPFVSMKIAMSMDGKIATRTGDSKWISGEKSRRFTQDLRDKYDAVMVGIGTVIKDNPRLTCRINGGHNPKRIIVDSKLRIPLSANVLKRAHGTVVIGCGKHENERKKKELEALGALVFECPRKDGEVDLKMFMKKIAETGVNSVLLEGGSALDGTMVDEKLVDKFYFFVAPKIIGGKDAKGPIGGIGAEMINDVLVLKDVSVTQIGVDWMFEGYVR